MHCSYFPLVSLGQQNYQVAYSIEKIALIGVFGCTKVFGEIITIYVTDETVTS